MILIGFNVCSGYAKVTLYVLNNAFWGCGGCNLQILCVHHACITHWAFLGSKTSDSICSESKRVWEDEDWFPQKKNSKYPAEPRLKNKYCKTTLSIITISYRHYSHTTPEASSEETDAIKKKILSWFTHLHGEYLYDFLSFVKHKRWYFNFIFLPYNEV